MPERFSEAETRDLLPYFTNVDAPIFGLRLPQEVAGALFSRYSRSSKSLRRMFLDEFHGAGGLAAGRLETAADDPEALKKARAFYDRVLVGYGDDSVAQLGGAHVAVERISNVAAKVLEDGRVGIAYLEKSTRYVRFDQKDEDGRWLYHAEEAVMSSRHRDGYLALMNRLFATYASQMEEMIAYITRLLPIDEVELRHPKTGEAVLARDLAGDASGRAWAERAYSSTVRAHACDVMRSYLPGATLTNLGVFASGQAFEHLLNKLASSDLAECRGMAAAMRAALDQLIPSFVKRAGESEYLVSVRRTGREAAERLFGRLAPLRAADVTLVDADPDAEERVLSALFYPHSDLPLSDLRERVRLMPLKERGDFLLEWAAARRNRRDKPERALESVFYTFDLLVSFGIYRDLQRHRLLTQERQAFTTVHGYDMPPEIEEAGFSNAFTECMGRAHDLHESMRKDLPLEAQYVVPFAFKVRWYVKLNLREAVHFCELRSMPQGHPDYRRVVQTMWKKIEEVHPTLSCFAKFLDRETYRLGRLQSEMRTEYKRSLIG